MAQSNVRTLVKEILLAAAIYPIANTFIDNSNLSAQDKSNLKLVVTLGVLAIVFVAVDKF